MLRMSYLVILLLAPLMAHADVNPINGDFYITYTDATISGPGHEIEMARTYNSRSTNLGWFGYGWGSPFETHLTVMPDQSAVIVENGNGATSYFHDESSVQNPKRVAAGVAKIVAAAKAQDKLSDDAAKSLTKKLMGDEEERLKAVIKYHVVSQLPLGRELTAHGRGYCAGKLQRTDTGYRRDNGCGSTDEFDKRGNLTKLTRNDGDDGYQLTFRVENDRPVEITNFDGRGFKLSWTLDGQVKRLITSDGTTVTYAYDDEHNLTLNSIIDGNFYRYDYDHNHNLTRIGYIDGTSKFITYTANGATTSVTETNGERTLYEYIPPPKVSTDYSTRIRKIDTDGTETSKTIRYRNASTSTGEHGLKSYSVETQQCDEITELDAKGRIIGKKSASGDVISYTYHPTMDKIVMVMLNNEMRARYRYSDAGDLIHAEDSTGKSADFEYDSNKHISHLIMANHAGGQDQLSFKYDDHGHPVEIKHPEFGSIDVEYDDKGEISHIDSSAGTTIAFRVVTIFQDMMSLVNLIKL